MNLNNFFDPKDHKRKLTESEDSGVKEGQPGKLKPSEYKYHSKTKSGVIFLNDDGKQELFSKIASPTSWHLVYKGKAYEFVSSKVTESYHVPTDEAKKLSKPVYNFVKITYDQFEYLPCTHQEEDGFDGASVIVAYDDDNCIAMYYKRAKYGSSCPEFKGDMIDYSEHDTLWPDIYEELIDESWGDDTQHYQLTAQIKKITNAGHTVTSVDHTGSADWRKSGDEPPQAEIHYIDSKTKKPTSIRWKPKAKPVGANQMAEARGDKFKLKDRVRFTGPTMYHPDTHEPYVIDATGHIGNIYLDNYLFMFDEPVTMYDRQGNAYQTDREEVHPMFLTRIKDKVDEVSTGKKMAVAYRAGKRYMDARNQDDYLKKIGADNLVAADVTNKKKHVDTIRRSGTMGKLASIAGALKKTTEGYTVIPKIDADRFGPRRGLEGPFTAKNGTVVYYDPKEGRYYDPTSDFYIDHDDWFAMNEAINMDAMTPELEVFIEMFPKAEQAMHNAIRNFEHAHDAADHVFSSVKIPYPVWVKVKPAVIKYFKRYGLIEGLNEVSIDTLVAATKNASDPDATGKYHDSDKYADYATKKFGSKIGKQVRNAADSHWPKNYNGRSAPYGRDELATKTTSRVTTNGKIHKQDSSKMKADLKRRFNKTDEVIAEAVPAEHKGYQLDLKNYNLLKDGTKVADALPASMFGHNYDFKFFDKQAEAEWHEFCGLLSQSEVAEILSKNAITEGPNESELDEISPALEKSWSDKAGASITALANKGQALTRQGEIEQGGKVTNKAVRRFGRNWKLVRKAEKAYQVKHGTTPYLPESVESADRPYVCVHAQKGTCDVQAKTSYEAAKLAAAKWKLKGTKGIDAHLADVKHVARESRITEASDQVSQLLAQLKSLQSVKISGVDASDGSDVHDTFVYLSDIEALIRQAGRWVPNTSRGSIAEGAGVPYNVEVIAKVQKTITVTAITSVDAWHEAEKMGYEVVRAWPQD